MTTSVGYEFQLAVGGANRRYFVAPVFSSDGNLRQISISQDAPPDKPGQTIHISMDPAVFKQTAMPGVEVLSRIAIGQAFQDKLFSAQEPADGILLDFTIEPWEGELKPLNS
jgi:hypothetical protein